MNFLRKISFSVAFATFQKEYVKTFADENKLDYMSDFINMKSSELKEKNDILLHDLNQLKTKYDTVMSYLPELPKSTLKLINDYNDGNRAVFGQDGIFERIYELPNIINDAIVPALEHYENDDINSAWHVMKSYTDKEITVKKSDNIELFMPLLQHLYLHLFQQDNTTKDDDDFMIQQKHLLRTCTISNINIDMLELCTIYVKNNYDSSNSEYKAQLNNLMTHFELDEANPHDFDVDSFYSEGLHDIFKVNNMIIAHELEKQLPGYLSIYKTEVEYRYLLDKIEALNKKLSISDMNDYLQENSMNNHLSYFKEYENNMIVVLSKIENNIANTTVKDSDGFWNQVEKEDVLSSYQDFFLPALNAMIENNHFKAYEITLNYFESNIGVLDNEDNFTMDETLANLALNIFIINYQHINDAAEEVIGKLLDTTANDDSSVYLHNILMALNNDKPLKEALESEGEPEEDEFDNFIINASMEELKNHQNTARMKF